MEDKKAPPAARVTAATEILSRGWGRPAQRLEAEAGRPRYHRQMEAEYNPYREIDADHNSSYTYDYNPFAERW